MDQFYKQAEVDVIIRDLTEITEDLLNENVKLAQRNEELQKQLQSKSAETDKVVLEKVAKSQQQMFPPEEVRAYMQKLAQAGFLTRDPETVAEYVNKDPGQLLKVASRVAELSAATPVTGQGVQDPRGDGQSKSASRTTRELEDDGWLDIVN
jgi:regulator of replication initiation timing